MRDPASGEVFVYERGAKFLLPDIATTARERKEAEDAPSAILASLPTVPRDGTFVREHDSDDVYVVKRGAKFSVCEADLKEITTHGLGILTVPNKSLDLLPYKGKGLSLWLRHRPHLVTNGSLEFVFGPPPTRC